MIAEERRVRVGLILSPVTDPRVRQYVYCSSRRCGWHGTIHDADLIQSGPRRRSGRLYICCPTCGGELIDLSTDELRRWL
jgi:4-hydroxy-3-methylbut-2-en-1-yl diphosphate synthase IspG/GcpE